MCIKTWITVTVGPAGSVNESELAHFLFNYNYVLLLALSGTVYACCICM